MWASHSKAPGSAMGGGGRGQGSPSLESLTLSNWHGVGVAAGRGLVTARVPGRSRGYLEGGGGLSPPTLIPKRAHNWQQQEPLHVDCVTLTHKEAAE